MSQEGQALAEKAPASPRPTPPALCLPVPQEKILQDFQVLVQKVGGRPEVLLIGETLEGKDIHGLMASFVKDLFSAPCQPVHPGDILKEPPPTQCSVGGQECQLVFFLCRASCLKGKQAELQKVLAEVKRFIQKTPCALVGILMEPKKGEAEAARAQLLRLLRGVFPKPPGQKRAKKTPSARPTKGGSDKPASLELEDIEVEAEIYVPGQPRGNLAIMKAACRASEALAKSRGVPEEEGSKEHPLTVAGSSWSMKLLKGFLGAACLVGMVWATWLYISKYGLIPPNRMPSSLLIFT